MKKHYVTIRFQSDIPIHLEVPADFCWYDLTEDEKEHYYDLAIKQLKENPNYISPDLELVKEESGLLIDTTE